ncbi:MAG: ester cyclase, partial [Dinghuibacter sp.]|nr:ester cyclase [Dinghuibacter sp.]
MLVKSEQKVSREVNKKRFYVCIMSKTQIQEWAEQLFEAWNSYDVQRVLDMYHNDFVREDLGNHKLYSKEELGKTVQAYITGIPDIQYRIEKLIGCNNQVTICWRAIGHHRGKIMNIP